jgi:hypothetical protein
VHTNGACFEEGQKGGLARPAPLSFQRLQVFDDALALSAKCGPLWVTFEGVRLLVGNSREKDVEAISHTEVDGEKCHWFAGSPAPRVASGVESSASQARKSL